MTNGDRTWNGIPPAEQCDQRTETGVHIYAMMDGLMLCSRWEVNTTTLMHPSKTKFSRAFNIVPTTSECVAFCFYAKGGFLPLSISVAITTEIHSFMDIRRVSTRIGSNRVNFIDSCKSGTNPPLCGELQLFIIQCNINKAF